MHYPHVRYYLINPVLGKIKLNFEPINWNEDDKKLVRNEESWGVFTELSNDLQFVKDGKDIIREVYETQGTEAELILERYEAFETNKGYELDYRGYLDLKTYQLEDEKVSVQFLTGGLQSLIESQFDEAYELDRGTDINGNQISELNYDTIYWEGRRIFLESLSETPENEENNKNFEIYNAVGNGQISGYPVELNRIYESQGLSLNSVFQEQNVNLTEYSNVYIVNNVFRPSGSGVTFFNDTDTQIQFEAIISFDFNIFIQTVDPTRRSEIDRYSLNVGFSVYEFVDGQFEFRRIQNVFENPNFVDLFQGDVNGNNYVESPRVQESNLKTTVTVNPNEGIVLTPWLQYVSEITPSGFAELTLNISNYNFDLKIQQNSEFEPTEFNGIRLYDAFNRMLEIYTGERDRLKSNYFNLGQFRNTLLSSGRYIRNLPDARLSVELKDLYETNNYFNLGWSVENINNKEYFVVEPKRYFFQNTVVLDLGEVANLAIRCKSDLLYKSMTFGNPKAGDYEEVQGLQEYNAETTYVSHLKTSDTKYEVNANIRADLVGAELARRKNYSVSPNEDTRYDNENFLFDCKPFEAEKFTPKVWQDVLDAEPNVYDPETAGNLLFTPFRSMQRHSKIFNAGMKVYLDKFTRFSNGTGKVDVSTKLAGEPVRAENSDIVNSELETPIFEAVEYQFNLPITNRIRKALKGKTNVQGRLIPNVNFLVKFAYKGQDYTGYILEISYNGQGQWKLIKNYD